MGKRQIKNKNHKGFQNPSTARKEKIWGERYSNLNDKKKIKCEKNIPIILIFGQSNAANSLKGYDDINNDQINFFNQNCYKLKV